jgi:iron complex outermembrane recepter protein
MAKWQWLAAGAALGVSSGALAQEAVPPASGAETAAAADAVDPTEIVVTARRTAERLQDVPIAVSAITGDQIAATGARGLEDIARQTPGFSFERTTGTVAQPVIRGQAQARLTNPVQNVATFFNGIYLQRPYQVDSELLDLERVEVIKGPQSALFGRNAFAGAISYITRKPDLEERSARLEATIGNRDRRELKGAVSVPLAPGVISLGLAGSTTEFDGTWRNNHPLADASGGAVRTRGRVGGYDNQGFLAQLRIQPSDILELNAFWNRRDIFIESPANYQIASRGLVSAFNLNNCTPFEAPAQARLGTNALICGKLPATPVLAAGEPRAPGIVADPRSFSQDSRTNVGGVTLDLEASEALSFTYQLGHTDADALSFGTLSRDPQRGASGLVGPFAGFNGRVFFDSRGNGEIRSTSHELRANFEREAFRVLVGGYAARVRDFDYGASYATTPNSTAELNNILFPLGDLFPPGFSATNRRERVRGLFGLVSAEVVEGVRITAEGRETWERIRQQAATFPARTPVGTQFEREFQYFTPRLTVDWKPNDDTLVYASAARGVKSGGFNPAATLPAERVYAPEKNWTYEIGAKTDLLSTLTVNAAAFYVDWTSLQVNRSQTGGTIGTPLIIGNVGGAEVTGFEAQAVWRPIEALTLNLGGSYSRSRFKDGIVDPTVPRALCQNPVTLPPGSPACPYNGDIGGNRIPRTPNLQVNAGAAWRSDIGELFGEALALTARADASYQDKMFVDNTNTAFVPSRFLVDASVGLDGGWWTLRAFVRNAFDRKYASYAFVTFAGSGAGSGVTYSPLLGDRRSFGATLGLRF